MRRFLLLFAGLLLCAPATAQDAQPSAPRNLVETPSLAEAVAKHQLPPVAERLPRTPLVVAFDGEGQRIGRPGGTIGTLVARPRDLRYLSAYEYTRLVGYDASIKLKPDILEAVDDDGGSERTFTFTLREGHRWSDGHPFTAEDFRYWWEDIANSKELSPGGPPEFMLVNGKPPRFEVLDERHVRYSWDAPNPRFLPELAQPRDPYIYRPAHYLKPFNPKYAEKAKLDAAVKEAKVKSWVVLHIRRDDMADEGNPEIPTLAPWVVQTRAPASRYVFTRNPYFHRVDARGQQLPYVDEIHMDVASPNLFAAKANAGEPDLLFRGLTMGDIPVLKEGEREKGYRTNLWSTARGSELALYPNLNVADPVWRTLNRDIRYRRALSLAIDRRTLNNALLFGLGVEGNDTVVKQSPLFEPEFLTRNASYDPKEASRLLDEIGLTERNGAGIRLLPDGRELEVIVETDGESGNLVDGLTLIAEFWREVGVKLFVKPQERTILRNRTYAGMTIMVAAQGLDLALATAKMPPDELAPLHQDNYAWPRWGQFAETKGKAGEPCDIPEAKALLDLYGRWMATADEGEQTRIWRAMLQNRADNQWIIGTVAGAIQPVVAKDALANVPKKGIYSWAPTAMIGVYGVDGFWWDRPPGRESRADAPR